jgi:hypothetical protein
VPCYTRAETLLKKEKRKKGKRGSVTINLSLYELKKQPKKNRYLQKAYNDKQTL